MTLNIGDTTMLDDVDIHILSTLSNEGGRIEDDQGYATRLIFNGEPDFKKRYTPSEHLKMLERLGLIERDIRGKRTYSVALTEQGLRAAEKMGEILQNQGVSFADASDEQLLDEVAVRMKTEDHSDCQATIDQITMANEQFKGSQENMVIMLDSIKATIDDVNDGKLTLLKATTDITQTMDEWMTEEQKTE